MTDQNLPAEQAKPRMVVATEVGQTQMAMDLGERFGMPSEQLARLVKTTLITVPDRKGEPPVSDAELAIFLSTCRQYDLNPLQGQVHGWRDNRGKMNVMIAYDGWVDYANRQPGFRSVTYKYGNLVASPDENGRQCWEWIQATVHDSIKGDIPQVPVFLEEWYVPGTARGNWVPPWQDKTKHKLHVITYRLAIREVYGFGAGTVIDEDQPIHRITRVRDLSTMTDGKTEAMAGGTFAGALEGAPVASATAPPPDRHPMADQMAAEVDKPFMDPDNHAAEVEAVMAGQYGQSSLDIDEVRAEHDFNNKRANELIDAMAGEEVYPDEEEQITDGEVDPEDGNFTPCGVRLCSLPGNTKCLSCGDWVCVQHYDFQAGECVRCAKGE